RQNKEAKRSQLSFYESTLHPNPTQIVETEAGSSLTTTSEFATLNKAISDNNNIFNQTINITNEATTILVNETEKTKGKQKDDDGDKEKEDVVMDGVNEKWLHSTYKSYLKYALPKLPFMCREPFTYFWNNLIKYKRKFVEIEQLKEEIDEENFKKARQVKTPNFQTPKNAGKLDFTKFEREKTKELNQQYYDKIYEHATKLYRQHVEELKNYLESITIDRNKISFSEDFPFTVDTYGNAFGTGADLFKDLYAEGLLVLANTLEKQKKIREEKLKRQRKPAEATLNEALNEKIRAQIEIKVRIFTRPCPPHGKPEPKTGLPLKHEPRLQNRSHDQDRQRTGHLHAAALKCRLLNYGHKFIPTPTSKQRMDITLPDNLILARSLDDLERRYNLLFEFGGDGRSKVVRIPNPTYQPPPTSATKTFINSLKSKISSDYIPTPHYNLTIREKQALHKLSKNKDIVITLTDKNLGLAIIPYNEYIAAMKGLLNLEDYEIVEQTEEECINIMQTQIFNLTITMDNKHNNYFLPEETQLPFFHILPKIHKNPLKWRPIVGMHSSPTKRLSVFLAQILKNWMEELENLDPENWTPLRDNFQLIFQIEKHNNRFNQVITGDFESLYTKFSHQEILDSIEYINNNILRIPTHYGLNFAKYKYMINTVISFNYFKALGNIYRQRNGIAMGTNAAVQIAQLTCYAHEHKAIKKGIFEGIFFRRYIDDIIILGNNINESLIEKIYPAHHKINWQHLDNNTKANFLDLTIEIIEKQVSTKRYSKFPRLASFVHYKSNHRMCMKKQVVTNELSRIALLCSNESDYKNEKVELFNFLKEYKGYPDYVLKEADSVKWEDRKNNLLLINSKRTEEKPLPPIILRIPYDTILFKNKNYSKILHETYNETLGHLEVQKPVLCITNMPSLVRILARSSTGHPNPIPNPNQKIMTTTSM
ncbi:222_t:CDS:2, partial [Gigaspora rosea]